MNFGPRKVRMGALCHRGVGDFYGDRFVLGVSLTSFMFFIGFMCSCVLFGVLFVRFCVLFCVLFVCFCVLFVCFLCFFEYCDVHILARSAFSSLMRLFIGVLVDLFWFFWTASL